MNYFEVLLLGIIIFFPVIDLISEKYKSNNKIIEYIKIAFFLWVPTCLWIYLFSKGELSVVNIGLVVENNWQNILIGSFLILAIIYLLFLIRSIQSDEKLRAEIRSKCESYMDLMPVTKNEMLVFTLIVSVTAGICEELLFRAYLFNFLESHIGLVAAVLLSSVSFGMAHIYLGWQEVVRTGVVGAILCGIYIFTGNIILPILVHIFIDIYSGLMCYFAMRKSGGQLGDS